MVWHLACHRGTAYAGFVPLSGTFWEPIPRACSSGPVNLIHYHGTRDTVVPLQGRKIKDSHQGDVYEAFELMRSIGEYGPVETVQSADLQCSTQMSAGRTLLELCLFEGGHKFEAQHIERAWRAFGLDRG